MKTNMNPQRAAFMTGDGMSDDERAAFNLGAKGSDATIKERKLFEAWMKGHCWECAKWDEQINHYGDMTSRMLFAAWRDRAALAREGVV